MEYFLIVERKTSSAFCIVIFDFVFSFVLSKEPVFCPILPLC